MKHLCRICLKVINDLNFVALKTDEPSEIKMQLSFCVPEMVVDLVKDPVFCESCVSALYSAYNFKNLCLETEEHIKNLKTLLISNSIDIKESLDDLQQLLTNGTCEDNSEYKNTTEGFIITPNTNTLLSHEDLANGQNLNTKSQHSVTFPVESFNKIINANIVTSNGFSKPSKQTAVDKSDDSIWNTLVQPLAYEQEVKTEYKDITIDEDFSLPKVEPSWSYEGFENTSFEDAKSGDCTIYNENDRLSFQTDLVIPNSFVKLSRLPDKINKLNILQKGSTMALKRKINNNYYKYYKCNNCAYSTKSTSQLARHSVVHITKNNCALENQEIVHNPEKPFTCSHCMFKTHNKCSLTVHIRHRHMKKLFNCKVCEYTTVYKGFLKRHELIHEEPKRFSCASCKFYSLSKQKLKDHVRVHIGENPFACNECSFRSAQKSELIQHLKIHTNKKPFACTLCSFRSAHKSSLKAHIRMHTGEKPFACTVCDYRSAVQSDLRKHLRIHTGEKPFVCNVCDYRSAQKSSLKAHLSIHTGEKPYFCDVCTFRFSRHSNLQRHLRIHAGEKS